MIGFGIFGSLLFLIMLAVLELNKNTVLGFILLLAVTVGLVGAVMSMLVTLYSVISEAFPLLSSPRK